MSERMTVLVTGGAGYIGSHMVLALLDAGHTPVIIDDFSTGHEKLVPSGVPLFRGGKKGPSAFFQHFRILALFTLTLL